jgi:hypothetical protein
LGAVPEGSGKALTEQGDSLYNEDGIYTLKGEDHEAFLAILWRRSAKRLSGSE